MDKRIGILKKWTVAAVILCIAVGSLYSQETFKDGETTAETALPVKLEDGEYTISPKIQGWHGALKRDAYLEKVRVANGYMVLFISGSESRYFESGMILQDIDNPSITYKEITSDKNNDFRMITFKLPPQGRHFNLYDGVVPPNLMNDIILGRPDGK
ncbi:MAG: hypothetical protein J1G30_03905 [Spirochaetales bacterium]|nr:hypothetical protein [Spirochaetales bacterium]